MVASYFENICSLANATYKDYKTRLLGEEDCILRYITQYLSYKQLLIIANYLEILLIIPGI